MKNILQPPSGNWVIFTHLRLFIKWLNEKETWA